MVEIIAELGINANGDIELAKRLIDVAEAAGCDYVKFQKRNVNQVYTKEELDTPRISPFGKTNGDLKRGLEFSEDDYESIDTYCFGKEIGWFASPWDLDSLKFLSRFDYSEFIKIPSPLLTNKALLEACREIDKQVILSSGMSNIEMIDDAVRILGKEKIYCIMHCTSTYPSKPEELNLRCIMDFKERYGWTKVGFSNHNPGIIFMPIAVALGAEMIEFHITLDRSSWGSDQSASIESEGVFRLVKHIRNTEKAMGDGIKKILDSEIPIMNKLRR
jgi:N-acetylneuraminate synthase